MGIVASVLRNNAFILSSYAASLGLDCPVEASCRASFTMTKSKPASVNCIFDPLAMN